VNHHLNTRGLGESSSRPPPPLVPLPSPTSFFMKKGFFLFSASYTYSNTSGCVRRHCALFYERLDSVCLHASIHTFATCPYKDLNSSSIDLHLLGFCTMLCADGYQPFTRSIILLHIWKIPSSLSEWQKCHHHHHH
jgi:hypothetical protein